MIEQKRLGGDSVELWNDERQYLRVYRMGNGQWNVARHLRGAHIRRANFLGRGTSLGKFKTADEAVQFAKQYLEMGKDALDKALRDI